ncbi:spindle and centriole-associated protein 1-like isoform X2 [Corticium candelabrum]|uniref:spindle and centriole-associated protein 1-like isoform X2 n=1 Tax=Corticium candelabrum TaxID=121492 RepID=UPI002E265C06|nr:spindle and centriole-associated protein 1-like isoform X2 [Corticium candelabrum]
MFDRKGANGQESSSKPTIRAPRRKPEWDSTVSDLSVYRLSKHEVERRKRIHQSHNVAMARQELIEKQLQQQEVKTPPPALLKGPLRVLNPTPHSTATSHHHAAVLRDVFHRGNELRDVLAQSDHMLSQVKDMFGDDPQHYTGFPTLTVAPSSVSLKERAASQDASKYPSVLYSPAGIRDDSLSIISKPALNDEVEDKENVGRESFDGLRDDHHNSVSSPNDRHSPICASEESHQEGVSLSLSTNAVLSITAAHDKASLAGQSIISGAGHIIASADSQKLNIDGLSVVCEESEHSHSYTFAEQNRSGALTMDSFGVVLESLEQEIMDYEAATGREPAHLGLPSKSGSTVGGYTAILLSAVVRLTGYLKESYLQLQREVAVRNKLLESLSLQQSLLDQFSSDILEMQQLFNTSMADAKQQNAHQVASLQARISRLEAALSGNSRTAAVGIGMAAPSHHPVAGGASTSRDEAIIPSFAAQENRETLSNVQLPSSTRNADADSSVAPVT